MIVTLAHDYTLSLNVHVIPQILCILTSRTDAASYLTVAVMWPPMDGMQERRSGSTKLVRYKSKLGHLVPLHTRLYGSVFT